MRKATQICREKHFWLDLRPVHTLSQASFLPQAISAIGSSSVLWLSKIPVLLQGCRGSRLKGCAPSWGDEELLSGPWWLLPTSTGLRQLLVALLQHSDLAPLPPIIPEGSFKERNCTPPWRTQRERHPPKPPTAPCPPL